MSDNELRQALAGASRERLEFIHAVLLDYLQALMAPAPQPDDAPALAAAPQPDDAPALAAAVEQWLGDGGPNE